uniref:MH2 domain-containing protein n=1 Tax=Heterorhabditis bacteriophora TaxID=37862 RepID=A0A1I7WPM8_HETBA
MVSRSALIDRVLQDLSCTVASKTNPTWTDIYRFEEVPPITNCRYSLRKYGIYVQDNLHEVDIKMQDIDNQIWAKLIIMEKGTRIAKVCSLRVIKSNDHYDFNGSRLGIQCFRNPQRDVNSELDIDLLGKGIELSIDDDGSIWVRNSTDRSLIVVSQGIKYQVCSISEKIFDLNIFKDCIFQQCNITNGRQDTIVYIQFSPCDDILSCPLLLCLINIIAIQMASLLSNPTTCTLTNVSNNDSTNPVPQTIYNSSLDIVKLPNKGTTSQSNSSLSKSTINLSQISTDKEYSVPQIIVSPVNQQQSLDDCIVNLNSIYCTSVNSNKSSNTIKSVTHNSSSTSTTQTRLKRTTNSKKFISNKEGVNRQTWEVKESTKKRESNASTMLAIGSLQQVVIYIDTNQDSCAPLINLRTLINLRRPAYFSHTISKRGGLGHLLKENKDDQE